MAIVEIPITHGSYVADSVPLSRQEAINVYPEMIEVPALSKQILVGTPGIELVATTETSTVNACRGVGRLVDQPYFVNGQTLYRLNADHTTTSIGTILGEDRVFMAENGSQLMIITEVAGYIYDGTTLSEISDVDYDEANGVPQSVVFIDGYFLCTTDSDRITVSALNDGTNWSALDFGTAESSPDGLVAPFVFQNQLYIGGTRTIEQFTNVGGANFPFQRTGLFLDKGLTSPHGVVPLSNVAIFVGQGDTESPAIWSLSGGELAKVSTHAIDAKLDRLSLTERSQIFAWSYLEGGHHFACFALPDATYCFDLATGLWHTRMSRVESDGEQIEDVRNRVNGAISAYGSIYVGDSRDGRIGRLSRDVYTEYGNPILREFITQPVQNNMRPFSVPMVELTVESGVGALGVDPVVRMSVSRDMGHTWGNERPRSVGAEGEYQKRLVWRRNGNFDRSAVFKFETSEAVKPVFLGLLADVVLNDKRETPRAMG